ncbi:MAG: SusC/RagA family TonB-linked outer membrane protein [Chitinophagaceae bacterium]
MKNWKCGVALTASLLCTALLNPIKAQSVHVSGSIRNKADGNLLTGVAILNKRTLSASESADGYYLVSARPGDTLLFTHIGMDSVSIRTPADAATVDVLMSPNYNGLNDVVVTAYGVNRTKKSLGYSVPTVNGDEVAQTLRNGFFNGLQGRVPGLSVNATSGDPGASAQIVLRGFVSISGDNSALIVVDGVPIDNSVVSQTNDLVTGAANRYQDYSNRGLDINPAEIESYTILKGPEATALYGSRGSSGAIVITTKKASVKGGISYNNSFNLTKYRKFPDVQTKYTTGTNGIYSGTTTLAFGPAFSDSVVLYDNMSAFFETAFTNRHNLAAEGGNGKLNYRWANEYTDNSGAIPTTRYRRFSSRLSSVANISPILRMTTSFNYINTYNRKANKGAFGYLMALQRYPVNYDVTEYEDENGNRILRRGTIYTEVDNPFWDIYKNLNEDRTNRLLANSNIRVKPVKWLTVEGVVGADVSMTSGISVYHAQSYLGSGSSTAVTGGTVTQYDRTSRIFNTALTATAVHNFGKFSNTYIIGGTLSDNNYTTNSEYGQNMYDQNFYSINNTLNTTQRTMTAVNRFRNVGLFGQAIIGYEQMLYLTLSGRIDGASKLMPNKPFFAYPGVSAAFNFSQIKGFKEAVPWMGLGKLRFSWAETGKEPWRQYSTNSTLVASSYTGGGFAYSYYGGNPALKQETSQNIEIGTELHMLNNRVNLDFDVYRLRSIHQVINPRISYGSGYVLEMMNGGTVENKGLEAQLAVTPVQTNDFSWTVTFNYAMNRGKVTALSSLLPELYDSDTWVLNNVRSAVFPGASTGALSGIMFDRNNNGDILINPSTGMPYITNNTYQQIADRTPKFTLGTVNNISYKSWSLSFLWDLRYGGDVLNGTEYVNYTRGNSVKTLDREVGRVLDGVLKDGLENSSNPTKNKIAVVPYYNYTYYTTYVSPELFVEKKVKALRLRDITLSFNLPQTVLAKSRYLKGLGLFVTLTDVVLLTNYSGIDPESNANNASLGGMGGYGIDYGNMGAPFGMNAGLKVKF